MNNSPSVLFVERFVTLSYQATFSARGARPRRHAWDLTALGSLEALGHTLKSHFAIRIL